MGCGTGTGSMGEATGEVLQQIHGWSSLDRGGACQRRVARDVSFPQATVQLVCAWSFLGASELLRIACLSAEGVGCDTL